MECILLLFHGTILIIYHLKLYIFHRIKGDSLFCVSDTALWLLSSVLARQDDKKQVRFPFLSMLRKSPKV